nr:hypothetical protein [Acidomonas methanolica]
MAGGVSMAAAIRAGERIAPGPFPPESFVLDERQWEAMVEAAVADPLWFIGHWCEAGRAYALFLDRERPLMAGTALVDGRYLALSRALPAACWAERAAQDLSDARPMFAREVAPLLDEGGWLRATPLSPRPGPGQAAREARPEAEPLGMGFGAAAALLTPVMADGRLEMRPSLAHRGFLARLRGMRVEEALVPVGRVHAGGFVAHPLAYCRAVEQALGAVVPPEGRDGRIVLAEIERIGVHLADLAASGRAAGGGLLATHAALARQALAELCVTHGATPRLTDAIAPDGVAEGIAAPELGMAAAALMEERLPDLTEAHRLFAERLRGVAVLGRGLVERFCIGGLAGRATGRSFDLRQQEEDHRHMPGRAGSLVEGDALARGTLRLREIRDSALRIARVAERFGDGGVPPVGAHGGEGVGAAEGPRGDVWYWVRVKDGRIEAIWARDPAFSLGPALGAVLRREDAARWPLALASLGVPAAGMAL